MNITEAQYVRSLIDSNENVCIKATIDGQESHVPLVAGNRHYDEIMKQVNDGNLTIANAE